MSAKKLVLFDIDGTLVTGIDDKALLAGFTEDRFELTIRNALGVEATHDRSSRGLTDRLILKDMLARIGWDEARAEAALPKLIAELDAIHEKMFRPELIMLIPGVKELLTALAEREHVLGLVTGNLQTLAKQKLEALDIWSFFSVGGFGSDPHVVRADLVEIAIKRADFERKKQDVYVIGDTARDIEAARGAGVTHSVGVANGFRPVEELENAGASVALTDFSDTNAVLKALDL